jgi:hypothetical protein
MALGGPRGGTNGRFQLIGGAKAKPAMTRASSEADRQDFDYDGLDHPDAVSNLSNLAMRYSVTPGALFRKLS